MPEIRQVQVGQARPLARSLPGRADRRHPLAGRVPEDIRWSNVVVRTSRVYGNANACNPLDSCTTTYCLPWCK